MMSLSAIRAAVRDLKRRVLLGVARSVIRAVNDSTEAQECQVELLKGELRDRLERFQEYGYTSVPLAGAEAAAVFVGGNRDHGIIIATEDRRYRLKSLKPGEVAIYTDEGDKVHLKRNGNIEVVAGTKLKITAPLVKVIGELEVTGDITDRKNSGGSSMESIRDTYNSHDHPENDGGNTGDPNQQM